MDFEIKKISAQETLPIRHKVMWPNQTIAYVRLPNDATGRHFGLFVKDELVSVISIFKENQAIQFRKFATLNKFQGKGFGTQLLRFIISLIEEEGYDRIWCNARVSKTEFYNKFGFQKTAKLFEKGGIGYVVMEKIAPFRKNHRIFHNFASKLADTL